MNRATKVSAIVVAVLMLTAIGFAFTGCATAWEGEGKSKGSIAIDAPWSESRPTGG